MNDEIIDKKSQEVGLSNEFVRDHPYTYNPNDE
jgi:hypothetical protein